MTKSLEAKLYQATVLTFEGLAFSFPSSAVSEEEAQARPEVAVEVNFRGAFGGRLVLALSGGILHGLTANMLGAGQTATRNLELDALGELANVICGNVLNVIGGKESRFHLNAPRPVSPKALMPPKGLEAVSVQVGLEGGRADVLLVLDESASSIAGAA
jgi:CheY-specific phosphatase CheX